MAGTQYGGKKYFANTTRVKDWKKTNWTKVKFNQIISVKEIRIITLTQKPFLTSVTQNFDETQLIIFSPDLPRNWCRY